MAIEISHKKGNAPFEMVAQNENGATLTMDGSPKIGGENKGLTPMELVAAGVGGCSSIDVLMMIQKRNITVEDLSVKVETDREKVESHTEFTRVAVHFAIKADISEELFAKFVALSMDKYCSVSKLVEKTATVSYTTEVLPCS